MWAGDPAIRRQGTPWWQPTLDSEATAPGASFTLKDRETDPPTRFGLERKQGAVFGEGVRPRWRVFEPSQMTARRDGKSLLFGCQTKHEVCRETIDIALHLLVVRLGRNPVEICQVGVKHDALSPEDADPALYRMMTLEFHDSDSCARSRQTWSQSVTTCFRVHAREMSFLLD